MIIYLCAFIEPRYIKQAKVCIRSIREKGQFKGDIYLFTDLDVYIKDVIIIQTNVKNVEFSASFRLRIFDYLSLENIPNNEVLLYLDTDIVVVNKIPSFENIKDKIYLYGYPSKSQEGASCAGFITIDKHYTSKREICSGILLFRPSKKIKRVLDEAYSLYKTLVNRNKINEYWEQPALSYTLTKYDMVEPLLDRYVLELRENTTINKDIIFIHYCGIRDNNIYKMMENMIEESMV